MSTMTVKKAQSSPSLSKELINHLDMGVRISVSLSIRDSSAVAAEINYCANLSLQLLCYLRLGVFSLSAFHLASQKCHQALPA